MPEEKSKIVQLFSEIQHGNKAAFDELFALYYDKLLAFAIQYIKQTESAEEITSELFVRIWLKRDGLSKVLNPEVYLYVAVKNACLNLIRSDKKRYLLFVEQPSGQPFEQVADHYSTGIEDRELVKLLDFAVASLPEQRKLIFRLVKEQGLKNSTVAQILGISVRTVENQLYKAVKTLADSISGYLGYHPQTKISRKQTSSNLLMLFFL
ncbi:RNA polymerase sigma-70 factor [Pedobacter polaris]|uniref:RNA polymerase sigma-70 factor n=1 Tax=Pedobacter polaris TaxID=2571273 RepID=A0A4U1CJ30_9SPHI|nr:RNA polymerase sigma-70 factor [Pedobacter polaris]TKC06544.1 RNA polymerase sigma-70 factor [Pedobacter polaris]